MKKVPKHEHPESPWNESESSFRTVMIIWFILISLFIALVVFPTSNTNQNVRLEIYNILGSSITSENKEVVTGLNQIDVTISSQAKGIYLLKLIAGESTYVTRIVKN